MIARWWKSDADAVSCNLCFRRCVIKSGHSGKCGVRINENGRLLSNCLGKFCACAVDPVEKKPLYHWHSGRFIYSLGSVGCTMDCPFCQNNHIAFPAKDLREKVREAQFLSVHTLVKNIRDLGLDLLAFTYNEPTLQAEYICEAVPVLHEASISVALVTNGAMSHEAAKDLLSCLDANDAANIDLKAFNHDTYRKFAGDLDTVKENIRLFVSAGVHVEITNLVVTGLNDDTEEFCAMIDWIASISKEIPLHITRYFPARDYYAAPTSLEILNTFATIARTKLKHVHLGNV